MDPSPGLPPQILFSPEFTDGSRQTVCTLKLAKPVDIDPTPMTHLGSSHISPEAKLLIEKGLTALDTSISPVSAELYMLGIHPDHLARFGSETFHAEHQKFVPILLRTLTPAICNTHPGCCANFRKKLIDKLEDGKQQIIDSITANKLTAIPDLILELPTRPPRTCPSEASPNLRASTLPPVPRPSPANQTSDPDAPPRSRTRGESSHKATPNSAQIDQAPCNTAQNKALQPTDTSGSRCPDRFPHKAGRVMEQVRNELEAEKKRAKDRLLQERLDQAASPQSSTSLRSRITTCAKLATIGLVSLFAGMNNYGKHRDAIRSTLSPGLLPAYDATETALYGTYRAERAALQALAKRLNQAINGSHK